MLMLFRYDSDEEEEEATHLIVFVHGLAGLPSKIAAYQSLLIYVQGTSSELRQFRNFMRSALIAMHVEEEFHFYLATSLEDHTITLDLQKLGSLLANEIENYIRSNVLSCDKTPPLPPLSLLYFLQNSIAFVNVHLNLVLTDQVPRQVEFCGAFNGRCHY